jgi:arylsulfatase A-like enzyme
MRILVLEPVGLHTAYLGCYGNDWVATPNLDRLAAEGIVFDQHLVDHPELSLETPFFERSAGTGVHAWPGAPKPAAADAVSYRRVVCPTLADFAGAVAEVSAWLAEDSPVCWLEGPSLVPPWDLAEDLLSVYSEREEEEEDEAVAPWPAPPLGEAELTADDLVRLQDTYAAVVTYWDALLGHLLADLRARGSLDELIVWVTARAGLPLGEHGVVGQAGPGLHDELIHVPLLWRFPHATEAGLRVGALTQPVDLRPSLGELLGLPQGGIQGSSLRPLVRGQTRSIRPYACAALRSGGQQEWLLRTPEWAFHLSPGAPQAARLYVKPDDRWEVNDVRAHQPEVAERLEATLRAFASAVVRPGPLVYPPLAALQ